MRIIDLAREMVRLMGREKDVEVRVTGLRPGEKLHEELSFPVEELMRTPHPKIDKVWHEKELQVDFVARVDGLIEAAVRDDDERVRVLLADLVPTYEPSVPAPAAGPGVVALGTGAGPGPRPEEWQRPGEQQRPGEIAAGAAPPRNDVERAEDGFPQ